LRTLVSLQSNPSVLALLAELSAGADAEAAQSALALLKSIDLRGSKAHEKDIREALDYDYFLGNIEPIFQRKGADGESCAMCHMNHTILKLNPTPPDGALSEAELRENYLSALRVVDLSDPEQSLILLKPRMSFDGIELPGHYRKSHGGNIRWPEGKEHPDYRAILKWIQGARVGAELSSSP
jgi:hypothetical protein